MVGVEVSASSAHESVPLPFVFSTWLLFPKELGNFKLSITTCPVPSGEIFIFPLAPLAMVMFPVTALPVFKVRSVLSLDW